MNRIAVFYLARFAEGFTAFERFLESYKTQAAGVDHEFIVIAKGFEKRGHYAALAQTLGGIPHRVISVPDNIGFDLHAYKAAAAKVDCDVVCFLNTFTRLVAEDWLRKLVLNLAKPGVGLVGATASYESLINTFKVAHKVAWTASKEPAMDRELTERFEWLFRTHSPITAAALKSSRLRLRRRIGDLVRNRPSTESYSHDFVAHWAAMLAPGGDFNKVADVSPFPNPHVRSNVFMLRKSDFESVPLAGKTKLDCCRFESGPNGMSSLMRKAGMDILLVGANGRGYSVSEWPAAGCFRSKTQENLLAQDNQTQEWANYSRAERDVIARMTWGGLESPNGAEVKLLGVHFSKKHSLDKVGIPLRASATNRRFSIVIPSHNRNALVLEAVQTVLLQKYSNWELCLFDNASTVPLTETLSELLKDPRIRVERSDSMLPVTGSWNRALDMATGEYVTLIGDDDGLLPEFFDRLNSLLDHFGNADVVFSSLVQFIHPGVSPIHKEGYLGTLPMADFMDEEPGPFILSRDQATTSVNDSLSLRRSFLFNMPAFTCKKLFLDGIRRDGKILHSPFPDYYFANVALELSGLTICEPTALAFQGVSKASFGFTLLNNITDVGFKLLGETANDPKFEDLKRSLLPGSRYWTEYIITMEHVASVINDPARRPDFDRYRKHQILERMRSNEKTVNSELWSLLSAHEKGWVIKIAGVSRLGKRSARLRSWLRQMEQQAGPYKSPIGTKVLNKGDHVNGVDIYKAYEANAYPRN